MNNCTKLFYDVLGETYGDVPPDSDLVKEWNKVIVNAKREFFKSEIVKHLKLKMECEELGESMKKIKEDNKRLMEKKAQLGAQERNTLYFWITINPKTSIKLNDFLNQLKKYASRSMFDEYMYVVEQRGTTEKTAGKGFHAHMLLKRSMKYKPSKVILNSKNTWKSYTNVENTSIFNFHWCPSEFLQDKKEYMSSGGKTGEGKDAKQTIDILWRQNNEIKTFYESE